MTELEIQLLDQHGIALLLLRKTRDALGHDWEGNSLYQEIECFLDKHKEAV